MSNRKDYVAVECHFMASNVHFRAMSMTARLVYLYLWTLARDIRRVRIPRGEFTSYALAAYMRCDVRTLERCLDICCKSTLITMTEDFIEVHGVDELNAKVGWKDSDVRWNQDKRRVEVVFPGVSGSGSGSDIDSDSVSVSGNGLLRAWEMDIMGAAGLPTGAIPPMSGADRNRPEGAGWKELDATIRWAEAEYGGADAVRARLIELCRQHKAGKLKLFSLKATLNSPDLMRPKPARETLEEYNARIANLPG